MSVIRVSSLLRHILLSAAVAAIPFGANAQEKHYRFAYDQPTTTGYGVVGDIFANKMKELSKGQFLVDQYPGAQLGQEPQVLQLLKSGDIDFAISSSANAATVSPQAGVMSLHFLFRSEDHLTKALADPRVSEAVKAMIEETVQGSHVIALATLGLRSMYSKKEVHKVDDIKALGDQKVFEAIRDMIDDTVQGIHAIGLGTQGFRHMYGRKEVHKIEDLKGYKVRVQATATEDTMFAAYGAQTVHMPFGSVYTSLQTGVMDFGENAVNVYLINKHYEAAPVLSMTEHEANNAILWISDKLWQSLNADQKQWVLTSARDVSTQEPKRAFDLERSAAVKLEKMGVKIVADVDKSGFQKIADPYLDKLAKELGPHADKIKSLIRAID